MASKVKVAVVGTGSLGKEHVRVYAELAAAGQVELAGVYDASAEIARKVATKHGARVFDSVAELAVACDALSVSTPTTTHFGLACALLRQGGTHLAWAFRDGCARLSNVQRALWIGNCAGTIEAKCLDRHPGSRGPLTLSHRETLADGEGGRWWIFWCDSTASWKPPEVAADGQRLKLQTAGDQGISWQIE